MRILLIVSSLSLSACSTASYLMQAGQGQLALFQRQKPLEEILIHPHTDARTKFFLNQIPLILKFVESKGMKTTESYRNFVKWDDENLVYVVTASPDTEFKGKVWSFPLVGSFNYLGFFKQSDAQEYAESLKDGATDVSVRGSSAYSTLGWFKDPLVSTMLPENEDALGDLVNLLIHESVHANIYVNGQSVFNESLADFIADVLTPEFLIKNNLKNAMQIFEAKNQKSKTIQNAFLKLTSKLSAIYSDSSKNREQKLAEKAKEISQVKNSLGLQQEINNASLIQYQTYFSVSDDWNDFYIKCEKDFPRFFAAVQVLKTSDFPQPQMNDLRHLLNQLPCPSGNW